MSKIVNPAVVELAKKAMEKIVLLQEGLSKVLSPPADGLTSPGAEVYNGDHAADEIEDRVRLWVKGPMADAYGVLGQAMGMDVLVEPVQPAGEMPPG